MKPSAAVIFEPVYYKKKEAYIKANYNEMYYVELDNAKVGRAFNGRSTIFIMDLKSKVFEKVIIAMPLSPIVKVVVQLLLKQGVRINDIVLLFDKPDYYSNEFVHRLRSDLKFSLDRDGEITYEVDGNKLLVGTDNELYIIAEIFGQSCYDFFLPYQNITLIDIGMNIGVASVYFSTKENINRIYSFEPFEPTYKRALENFKLNNIQDKIIPHNFGVGDKDKTLNVCYNENLKGLMSTVRDNDAYVDKLSKNVEIKVVDIAEVFTPIIEKHKGDKFVFKVDCEGAEYEVFERLDETRLIKKIQMVIMEWHNFGERNISQMEDILKKNNFIYHLQGYRGDKSGMLFAVNTIG